MNRVDRAYRVLLLCIDRDREWTQMDAEAFLRAVGPKAGRVAIRRFLHRHHGFVVTVPTSDAWVRPLRGGFLPWGSRVRWFYQDWEGRWISHIQVHRDILAQEREGKTP